MPAGCLVYGLPRHDQGNPVFWEGKEDLFFFLVVSAALALVTRQVSTGENHWRKDILTSRE